jgi:hypothetical protein
LSLLVVCSSGGANAAADPPEPAPQPALGAPITPGAALRTPITPDEIRAAAAKLRADPDLGGERKIRSLRWTQPSAPDRPQKPPPWLEGLFDYLGQTGSVLIWVAGAIAAAVAVIWAYRTFKARAPVPDPMPVPSPTRATVEMDIRPESLPDDIGAAALELAETGKMREALSLLYRGALSRAVHRFGVSIGESYTEGEALRAVGAHLDAARVSYFTDLVGTWRRAVYAGEPMTADRVGPLCRGFRAALDTAAA